MNPATHLITVQETSSMTMCVAFAVDKGKFRSLTVTKRSHRRGSHHAKHGSFVWYSRCPAGLSFSSSIIEGRVYHSRCFARPGCKLNASDQRSAIQIRGLVVATRGHLEATEEELCERKFTARRPFRVRFVCPTRYRWLAQVSLALSNPQDASCFLFVRSEGDFDMSRRSQSVDRSSYATCSTYKGYINQELWYPERHTQLAKRLLQRPRGRHKGTMIS